MAPIRPASHLHENIASDSLARQILDSLGEGVYLVDRERRIQFWNAASERISGYSAAEVLGRGCFDGILSHVDDTGRVLCQNGCPLAATIADGQPRQTRVYLQHRDGHRVPVNVRATAVRDEAGAIVGAAESFSDASPVHETAQEADELRRLAFVDELTGLPNRRSALRALDARLASLERHDWRFGLLFIDVDRFKEINDSLGHPVGDVALRLVARTISNACRSEDYVGRWGGDEFIVLVAAADAAALARTADRVRALVARTRLPGATAGMSLSVSVGAAIAEPGETAASLFERADRALYAAKASETPEGAPEAGRH